MYRKTHVFEVYIYIFWFYKTYWSGKTEKGRWKLEYFKKQKSNDF